MDKDIYDEQAERLLPCDCNNRDGREGHFSSCGGYWREEVAQALREAGKREAELRRALHKAAGYKIDRCACIFAGDDDSDPVTQCNYHRDIAAERDDLRREVERLKDNAQSQIDVYASESSERGREIIKLTAEIERLNTKVTSLRELASHNLDERERLVDGAARALKYLNDTRYNWNGPMHMAANTLAALLEAK